MFIPALRALKTTVLALFAVTLCLSFAQAQTQIAPVKLAMIEGLSGANGNGGEAVFRNLVWAVERVNARGGVRLAGINTPLLLTRYDSKGQTEDALSALRAAIDDGARFVLQGNSSAVAAALIDAVNKQHARRRPAVYGLQQVVPEQARRNAPINPAGLGHRAARPDPLADLAPGW